MEAFCIFGIMFCFPLVIRFVTFVLFCVYRVEKQPRENQNLHQGDPMRGSHAKSVDRGDTYSNDKLGEALGSAGAARG